jgi:aspartate/methionine/tyrosine aminotransferase
MSAKKKFEPFELERWLSTHAAKYNLAGALPRPLKYSDLIDEMDLEMTATYGSTQGCDELRAEIGNLYSEVDIERVLITNGTAEANFLVTNYLLNKGDEIVILMPTYLQVYGIARFIGAEVKLFYLQEKEDYKLDIEKLKEFVSPKTRAIFFTNPNNPTGSRLYSEEVKAICELAEDIGAYVVCDEALRGLEIDGVISASPVDIYERGICTGSLSKQGLSGLRIGWIVASKEIVEECWSYKDYTTLSHSGICELFAILALRKKNIEKIRERNRSIIRNNLKILLTWMREHQQTLRYVEPKAGATAFPSYNLDLTSYDFCEMLLREEDVLLSPGDCFKSPKHFRIRYAGHDEQTLTQALHRIGTFLERAKGSTRQTS